MKPLAWDIEVFPNYFLIMWYSEQDNKYHYVDTTTKLNQDQIQEIWMIMSNRNFLLCGYNTINYDLPVLLMALRGIPTSTIYQVSKSIIESDFGGPIPRKEFLEFVRRINHVDLMVLHGGWASLKCLGGRLHVPTIKDLPYPPDTQIEDNSTRHTIIEYCKNDVYTTMQVYHDLENEIKTRDTLDEMYPMLSERGYNARNLKKATLAENIICYSGNIKKQRGQNTDFRRNFKYTPPKQLQFDNPYLQNHLEHLQRGTFRVGDNHKIIAHDYFKTKHIPYGGSEWNIGIGGVHTRDKNKSIDTRHMEGYTIVNMDVSAYYPSIMLNLEIGPRNKDIKARMLRVLQNLVTLRKDAKFKKDKVMADALKVPINSVSGKLNDRFSAFYAPDDYIRMTISGQLMLIKLAELMYTSSKQRLVKIWSANTDGIIALVHNSAMPGIREAAEEWSKKFHYELDIEEFTGVYSRDVNNYFAFTKSGYIKKKGFFSEEYGGVKSVNNPVARVCNDAVINYIVHGVQIEHTINNCTDISRFVIVQNIKGQGCKWRGEKLGRVARFIWITDGEPILRVANDYKVPRSDSSMPVQTLPRAIPYNLDTERYITYAYDILASVGYNETEVF